MYFGNPKWPKRYLILIFSVDCRNQLVGLLCVSLDSGRDGEERVCASQSIGLHVMGCATDAKVENKIIVRRNIFVPQTLVVYK